MSWGVIRLPPDDTGKRVRALYKSISGDATYMEVLVLADQSGNLITPTNLLPVQISGQGVFLPATQVVKISGDTVVIESGQTVQLPSTQIVKTSGEWHEVHMLSGDISSNISGQWVEAHMLSGTISTEISGQGVFLPDTQVVKISGETVLVTRYLPTTASGSPVISSGDVGWLLTDTDGRVEAHVSSGEVTLPSTQQVQISGQGVFLPDTQVVKISGEQVAIESGQTVQLPSTQQVQISGQGVFLPDTQIVKISGDTVVIESGQTIQLPSTQVVKISGEAVIVASGVTVYRELLSGLYVQVSGQGVVLPSTQVVKISGETIDVQVPTIVKTGGIKLLDDNSGGVVLGSGATKSVIVKALGYSSGNVYVGGSGAERPYSGYGFCLEPGEGTNFDVTDFDALYVMSTISGFATVTFAGVN